jgi:metallo-beta-lactamase family protein
VVAEVNQLQSMSAHGDYDDLLKFIGGQEGNNLKQLFLVHGELEVQKDFFERLQRKGYENVIIPEMHNQYQLD